MPFTTHGHHIPGSGEDLFKPKSKERCGGIGACVQCSKETSQWLTVASSQGKINYEGKPSKGDNSMPLIEPQMKARILVMQYYNQRSTNQPITLDDVYVVWFVKALRNWKTMISTTVADGRYYELTYNGEQGEVYLDAYDKTENICIPDD